MASHEIKSNKIVIAENKEGELQTGQEISSLNPEEASAGEPLPAFDHSDREAQDGHPVRVSLGDRASANVAPTPRPKIVIEATDLDS